MSIRKPMHCKICIITVLLSSKRNCSLLFIITGTAPELLEQLGIGHVKVYIYIYNYNASMPNCHYCLSTSDFNVIGPSL